MGQRKNTQPASTTPPAEGTTETNQNTGPESADQSTPNADTKPDETTNNDNPDKDTPPDEPVETIAALALVDNHTHGLRCGFVCELPEDVAEQLEKDGVIDRNEKAIARGRRPAKAEQ